MRTRLLHLLVKLAERFGAPEGRLARLEVELSHEDLADMVGCSRESVTLTLRALMQADVGIALGAGTDIALEAAEVVLVGDRLMAFVEAVDLAIRSYSMMVTNVGLALSFNGFGVLAALSGQLAPVWAMLAMAASVATVLGRSLAVRL